MCYLSDKSLEVKEKSLSRGTEHLRGRLYLTQEEINCIQRINAHKRR
jgi:hypothetical protein